MICVFDVETIPDASVIRSVFGYEGSDEEVGVTAQEEFLKNNGTTFLPVCFHKIVCISAVIADDFGKFKRVSTMKGEDEKSRIAQFITFLNSHNPRLISFNGRGFDLPLIMARAMRYNLSAHSYFEVENKELNKSKWENYRYRYNERFHCDLLDQISDFGAIRGLKLDEICKSVGLPGKFDTKGDEVSTLFYSDSLDLIEQYCESDVLNTYWLFLKFELLKGNLVINDYCNYLSVMNEFIKSDDKNYKEVFSKAIEDEIKGILS